MRLYVIKKKGGNKLSDFVAVAQDFGIFENGVEIPLWGLKAFFLKKDAKKRLSKIKFNEELEIGTLETVERKIRKEMTKKTKELIKEAYKRGLTQGLESAYLSNPKDTEILDQVKNGMEVIANNYIVHIERRESERKYDLE